MASSKKIMLVEDDKNMRSVLRTLLEIEGFQVMMTTDEKQLEEVLQTVHNAHPDIVLLDVHLKDISGIEILKGLRADPEISKTRVVMSSGMDVKERCMAAGADDFLLKPYMPDELMQKLAG